MAEIQLKEKMEQNSNITEKRQPSHMLGTNMPDSGESSVYRTNKKSKCGYPPGLRGKAIGMYFANKYKLQRENATAKSSQSKMKKGWRHYASRVRSFETPRHEIEISEIKTNYIKQLLENIPPNIFFMKNSHNSKCIQNIKYNHIKDSNFKREFLKIISGSIEEKLNNSSLRNIVENNALNIKYKCELNDKQINNNIYIKMLQERKRLPSFQKREEILKVIQKNQVVVISGETGCGKTTQVAQFILDDFIMSGKGSECKVVCTQPRRISAIAVAERVAQERGESCIGFQSVGYQIRLERKLPRSSGSILFCTAGILLKQMEDDPYLSDISHLILDEIHERDIISDILITLLKIVIEKRPDLKLILMSATLNSDKFSAYYNNCPKIDIPGFTFPVQTFYLEDVLSLVSHTFPKSVKSRNNQATKEYYEYIIPFVNNIRSDYSDFVCDNLMKPSSEDLDLNLIYKLVLHICRNESHGAILIFLPGILDIQKLYGTLTNTNQFPRSRYLIIALHSKMSSVQQREVFDVPPEGVRKIVIATNIAETSITINDVVYVIDSGRIKIENYDSDNNIQTLQNQWVSLANASQRKGRAGRVRSGKCYYLFTRGREKCLENYQKPEILRTRLENVILIIKMLQLGKASTFLSGLMDQPDPKVIENAITNLQNMNAIDEVERLTPLGYQLAKLPIDPQLGKMILLGAWFSCLDPILSIATCLDFKDPFLLPLQNEQVAFRKKCELANECKSDHLLYAETLKQYEYVKRYGNAKKFCWEYFLSPYTLKLLENMKQQFADFLYEMNFISDRNIKGEEWNINSNNTNLIRAIVCGSLYPKVAIIRNFRPRNKRSSIITTEKEKAEIHPGSINRENFDAPFLVYYRKLKSSSIFLHDTTLIHPLHLIFFCGKFHVKTIDSDSYVLIDLSSALHFKCGQEAATLIGELRNKLDELIEYKVSHPGIIYWMENNHEANLLRVIVEFITSKLQSVKNSGNREIYFYS